MTGPTCKNICMRLILQKQRNNKRYANGIKRCTTCQKYIQTEGYYCPCCGTKLRSNPRGKIFKSKLQGIIT